MSFCSNLTWFLIYCIIKTDCCTKVSFLNNLITISKLGEHEPATTAMITGCLSPEIINEHLGQVIVTRIICINQTVPILYEKAVENLPELEQLVFGNDKIERIKENAFFNLPKLNSLLIHGNHIHTIERNAFVNLQYLHTLHLSGNKIESIELETFSNLPGLMYLLLNYNQLEAFEPDWFTNSFKLDEVDISHNIIRTVQKNTFTPFKNLQNIDLSYNRIKHIHKEAFSGLENLKFLYLHNNKIEKLDPYVFKPLKNLTDVWLHGNYFIHMPDTVLQALATPRMERITLHSNPWQCACYDKILHWAAVNSIDVYHDTLCYDITAPVCVVPIDNKDECLEVRDNDLYEVFHEISSAYFKCIEEEN